ncbi:MAG: hypothetical protein U9N76_01165 [Candidatus Marinimicrobia bacterium]|nr:hypothetical protein [Candidatus Neomarinimicrobiota bacterium]
MKGKVFLVMMIVVLVVFTGCLFDDDGPSDADKIQAQSKVLEANAEIVTFYDELQGIEDDSLMLEAVENFDFEAVNVLYNEALEYDPNNEEALFGEALSGLLAISNNEEFNTMMDEFETYFEANPPFEVSGSILGKSLLGMTFKPQKNILLPTISIEKTTQLLSKISDADVPQFSEVQELIRTVIIPRINTSITNIQKLESNSDFSFIVEVAVGDTTINIEFDLTEVYMVDAGLQGMKGEFTTALAYNLDIESYDDAGMVTALTLGSDFLALNSGGAADLSNAYSAINTGLEKVQSAIDYFKAETDDQSDDVIPNDDEGILEGLEDIEEGLEEANQAYTGKVWVDYPYSTIADSFQVEIKNIFINPINDFKAMVPPYTVTAGLDTSWYWNGSEEVMDLVSYYPIITWNQNSYSEWLNAWPDPTFNGIFCNFTTTELEKLMYLSEDDWKKVMD